MEFEEHFEIAFSNEENYPWFNKLYKHFTTPNYEQGLVNFIDWYDKRSTNIQDTAHLEKMCFKFSEWLISEGKWNGD